MKRLASVASLAVLTVVAAVGAAVSAVALTACLTAYNRPKYTPLEGAPAVEPRPEGCSVDVFEDGTPVDRPHADLGRVVLDWPQAKVKEQGPEGAIRTLKAAACENGAFLVKDVRALSTGAVESGLVYEGTLATLLGPDGQPMNPRRADAGPVAAAISEAAAKVPASTGW
jgi:hypothetical protein